MKSILAALLMAPILTTGTPALASPASEWEAVLEARLSQPEPDTGLRRFDYAGFTASPPEREALDTYIESLASTGEPEDAAEATAYWANLYNALTVDLIADEYPVTSIRKIKDGLFSIGPWKRDVITVEGETLSLDDIEHEILRERYPSPLIHYMVNCASVGCPNLQPTLWKAETLDADREAAAREFVNSPRGARLEGDRLVVSSIYKWFAEDFGDSKTNVVAHIREYADDETLARIGDRTKYDKDDYDWSLNGTTP